MRSQLPRHDMQSVTYYPASEASMSRERQEGRNSGTACTAAGNTRPAVSDRRFRLGPRSVFRTPRTTLTPLTPFIALRHQIVPEGRGLGSYRLALDSQNVVPHAC